MRPIDAEENATKTSEEIKAGLINDMACCSSCDHCYPTHDNPYGCHERAKQIEIAENAYALIQQLEAERDAAVRDLNNNWKCAICKRFTEPITDCPHYRECGLAYTFWEWRGVCAENGGVK